MKTRIIPVEGQFVDLVEIDLHGDTLYEVKTNLCHLVNDYLDQDFTIFRFVHGYRHGSVLKKYIRIDLKSKLRNKVNKKQLFCVDEQSGSTLYIFK